MRAFRLAYDGRPFYGFQRQPDVPTVEDTLFDALRTLDVLDADAGKPTGYAAAGRTDAGVSALAQTVAFECPDWLTPRALNSELPSTVRAWASAEVDADFHATHHAVRRVYAYYLYAPSMDPDKPHRTLDGRPPVDDSRLTAAIAALSGSHDFHNLTPDKTGTERDLEFHFRREGDVLRIEVAAGGFARELVRRLISVIQSVATGEQSIEWIEELLAADPVTPRPSPARPEPLLLSTVRYPDVDFERDPEAAHRGALAFGQQAVSERTAGRLSRAVATRLSTDDG